MDKEIIPHPTDLTITSQYRTTPQESKQIVTAIINQSEIGWEQILHGRISQD